MNFRRRDFIRSIEIPPLTLAGCVAKIQRRDFVLLLGGAVAGWSRVARAQQPGQLTKSQLDALSAYNDALKGLREVLRERRAQLGAHQPLPNLPGQALYLARIRTMSAYKDLTDAVPAKIGKANKFGIPPAYFDAGSEPLIDEYRALFDIIEAPPANAQSSDTPFKDVVDLGTAIARARGLDATHADVAGRISLGLFFAETNGKQNVGNARSNTYKGSFQTGPAEDQNGQKKWAALEKVDSGVQSRPDRA